MAGHSKWANTKHKKARLDGIRQKLWEKFLKEISVAAKLGGGDVDSNPRLRAAVAKAKSNSLPNKNIESAISKGLGGLQGDDLSELLYEGYGPSGTAFIVTALTNNPTRTVADLRLIFSKCQGSLGETGSVAWAFDHQGLFLINTSLDTESQFDQLFTQIFDTLVDAGVEDFETEEISSRSLMIKTSPQDFNTTLKTLQDQDLTLEVSELSYIPQTLIQVSDQDQDLIDKLMSMLDNNLDVQDYYHNVDLGSSD